MLYAPTARPGYEPARLRSCTAGSRRSSHNDRRMPSLFAITDNGSGRALGLFIQLPHPVLRLLAGRLEPVEHLDGRIDLVAVLPLGSIISSCKYSASQASSFGRWTKPFSITAV